MSISEIISDKFKEKLSLSYNWLYAEYSQIPLAERSCLMSTMSKFSHSKPLQNKTILFNCHITKITLLVIDILLMSGATVTVLTTNNLVIHAQSLIALVKTAAELPDRLSCITDIDVEQQSPKKYVYDIIIDCGGALLNFYVPKSHAVELTKVDEKKYQNIAYPVITIDKSKIKFIETYHGTADGFIRVFEEILSNDNKHNHAYRFYKLLANQAFCRRSTCKKNITGVYEK